MKTCVNDIKDFYVKLFEKDQKIRNFTCLYIALNSIQVESRIKLAIISG